MASTTATPLLSLVTSNSNKTRRNNINNQKHDNNGSRKQLCEANGIFWKSEDSKGGSQSSSDAYIPGVDLFNCKRSKNLKWQPYKVQPKSSTTFSGHVIKNLLPSPDESTASEKSSANQSGSQKSARQDFLDDYKKVYLKDLCQEEKIRIANLIQELAKAGEEREDALTKLTQEREDYEKKVKSLTDQVQLLSDEHKQTLCKMTDCHHLLNLYQHILIEQQQKKRHHSMPLAANTSKHNKENTRHGAKSQSTSLQPPPRRSMSRVQPLGTSSRLGHNLKSEKFICRSLSPSTLHTDSLYPTGRPYHDSRKRRSLSPRSPQPDSLPSGNCNHHYHNQRQQQSLSPSSFPYDRPNTQHPKFNSSYLLPRANEAGSTRISPRTSPSLSEHQLTNKSPRPLLEATRPNLKPATAIYKTSPSAPDLYGKTDAYNRDHSDAESLSQLSHHFQRSPTMRSVCSSNPGNQNNNSVFTNSELTPEPRRRRSWDSEKMSSPSSHLLKEKNMTSINKHKNRLSLGPLQDPVLSSTQRSSELHFNGSFASHNTASNHSCILRSPTSSVQSLPACFPVNKNSSANPYAPLKFETAQSDTDYSYVRKLSFSSSAQSLPTSLMYHEKVAPHSGSSDAAVIKDVSAAAVSKVSFADADKKLPNPGSPIHEAKEIKVPDTPNTDCFRLMSNGERRQFLLQQRALLEEERNRLLSILERPSLAPTFSAAASMGQPGERSEGGFGDRRIESGSLQDTDHPLVESRPNIDQELGGALLTANDLPINCFEKSTRSEPDSRTNKTDSLLQPLVPNPEQLLPPPPSYNSQDVEQDFPFVADDCSVRSNCSFSSKQSSMSLIDLIESMELKPQENNDDDNQDADPCPELNMSQNSLRIKNFSRQNRNSSLPQKEELTFENQVLQEIFFLN